MNCSEVALHHAIHVRGSVKSLTNFSKYCILTSVCKYFTLTYISKDTFCILVISGEILLTASLFADFLPLLPSIHNV